jgi:hypothetical protein
MKTYGERRYSSNIFYLGARWMWVVSFTPWKLFRQGKSPPDPSDRMLCVHQIWSGRCGEEKNLSPQPGIDHRPFIPYSIVIPTELSLHVFSEFLCNNGGCIQLTKTRHFGYGFANHVYRIFYCPQTAATALCPWVTETSLGNKCAE